MPVSASPPSPPASDPAAREADRLAALRRYRILDTAPEEAFDRLALLAQELFDAPAALISLVDDHRIWVKAQGGIALPAVPKELSFCTETVARDGILVVSDARADLRFAESPAVRLPPHIRFYCGAPLRTPEGQALGAICVLSPEPRPRPSARDLRRLEALAGIAMSEMELRLQTRLAAEALAEKELLLREVHHRAYNSLHLVHGMLTLQARGSTIPGLRAELEEAARRVISVARAHQRLQEGPSVEGGEAEDYLRPLLAELEGSFADAAQGRHIALRPAAGPLRLSAETLPLLGLVATELVTNAMKHGAGRVTVAVAASEPHGAVTVSVGDEGPGFPQGFEPGTARDGLGMRLVRMLSDGVRVDPEDPRRIQATLTTRGMAA